MLILDNLHKAYGTVKAVDGLSLKIPQGSIFGFLGPNGAGKTTTINLAVGLLQPSAGSVTLEGFGSPQEPKVRAQIGVAPQAIALYDTLTATENLRVFGQLYGLQARQLQARTDEMLERVGLADRARDRVATFSGGMKRRLNLAAALIHDPPLLMLDEPTAGVDPQSRNAILDTVRTLREQGKTIVYTTHYMEEAQRLCDQVAIIDHGKLLALDTVDNLIRAHGGNSQVTIQSTDGETRVQTAEPVTELIRRLKTDGSSEVLNVRVDRPDLESVFLNLTGRSLRD